MLALHTTSISGTSNSELLMKRKWQTLVPSLNINTEMKHKKPTVSQSRELQPLNINNTICYCQNNNWIGTGIILNKKDLRHC